jgi:hypothetical protein
MTKIIDRKIGESLDGPFLRPAKWQAVGVSMTRPAGHAICVTFDPRHDDPDFEEPVQIMIPAETAKEFLRTIEQTHAQLPRDELAGKA